MAIVVVVGDRNAHVVAGAGQASRIGHIGKCALAVIAEQAVAVLGRVFLQGGDIGAVGEEDVRTPVAVVVEDGHSAGHGFGSVLGRCFVVLQTKWNLEEFEADGAGGGGCVEENSARGSTAKPNDSSSQPVKQAFASEE